MRTFRSLLTGLGMAGLLVGTLNLAGCGATMPTATAGSQGDIATASDESWPPRISARGSSPPPLMS